MKFEFQMSYCTTIRHTLLIQAKIDINPFAPNFINTNAKGFDLVPVAVLWTKDFDPQTLDLDTVRFGALGTEAQVLNFFPKYANFDRTSDLILYFQLKKRASKQVTKLHTLLSDG